MTHDDAELVKWVLAGDKAAFGHLIDRYRSEAQGLARRMLGDSFEAEDITQEALLQAFLGLRTTMWVKARGRLRGIDARPSDAVTIALHMKAPIFLTPEVLEQSQTLLTADGVITGLDALHRKSIEEERTPVLGDQYGMAVVSFPAKGEGGGFKPAEK
jgi:hypothetical protein